jgi:hypothetical protein
MTLGVIGLLACLDPRPGRQPSVTAVEWIIGSAITVGPALAFFLAASVYLLSRSPALQAAAGADESADQAGGNGGRRGQRPATRPADAAGRHGRESSPA